jgi:hypothetical protein
MNNQNDNEELTQEQLNTRKEEMMTFYKESMPYLEVQLAYEETLLRIDEARFKRTGVQMQYAMLIQKSKEQEQDQDKDGSKKPFKEEPKK